MAPYKMVGLAIAKHKNKEMKPIFTDRVGKC